MRIINLVPPQYFPDEVQSFNVENSNIRDCLVRLGKAYEEILYNHHYPAQVASLIGKLTIIGISLANSLKYEGQFILQTQSDGPINLMVCNFTSSGKIRSYARYRIRDLPTKIRQNSLPYLLGNSQMTFTVDQGDNMYRYQGITALKGSNLAECAQNHLQQSEQIETAFLLTTNPEMKRAAGLMIQRMPIPDENCSETSKFALVSYDENWCNSVGLMNSITTEDLIDSKQEAYQIIYQLYHKTEIQLHRTTLLQFQCQCSHEKIKKPYLLFQQKRLMT